MSAKIRVGIIGCGKIAEVEHAIRFAALRGVTLAAFCDVVTSKAEAFQRTFAGNAAVFDDYRQMLKQEDLDAVAVCTPNDLHGRMTLDALRAGCHVLCEKPMAVSLAEASRVVGAAARAGKVLHINQSLRYSPHYQTVAELVRRGRIGDPIHVHCHRSCGSTPNHGWSPGADWFVSGRHHGGVVLDIAVHMADLMRWVAGDVAQIGAVTQTRTPGIDVTDHVAAVFRFANGATGALELSWANPAGAALFEVYGTKGCIRVGFSNDPIELISIRGGKRVVTTPPIKRAARNSHQTFLQAIRGVAPTATPGELGRDALALCVAIEEAGKAGRFVNVRHF